MKDLLRQFAAPVLNTGEDPNTQVNVPIGGADSLLQNGLNLTYFLAGTIAVIVIIAAGILYVTSSGDSAKVTRAKNTLTYSIVGLAVILSAFMATNFVIERFK